MTPRPNVPIQPVASPIICSPYVEPGEHWVFDTATGSAERLILASRALLGLDRTGDDADER